MFFYGWCSPAGWAAKLPGWRSNPIVNLVTNHTWLFTLYGSLMYNHLKRLFFLSVGVFYAHPSMHLIQNDKRVRCADRPSMAKWDYVIVYIHETIAIKWTVECDRTKKVATPRATFNAVILWTHAVQALLKAITALLAQSVIDLRTRPCQIKSA